MFGRFGAKPARLRQDQIGGATGSVGDPSGRSTERNALSAETLNANVEGITSQMTRFFSQGAVFAKTRMAKSAATKTTGQLKIANNLEWLKDMSLLDFLSGPGKGARVSTMLSRERRAVSKPS